jgi:hypothetical protein
MNYAGHGNQYSSIWPLNSQEKREILTAAHDQLPPSALRVDFHSIGLAAPE